MAVAAAINFIYSGFNTALLSMVTEAVGPSRTGMVLSCAGLAMLVGALVTTTRDLETDPLGVLARTLAVSAVGCVIAAARPSLALISVGVVVAVVGVPGANAATNTVYNRYVPPQMLGRVLALRGSLSQILSPLGAVSAGVAISLVLQPGVEAGGWLHEPTKRILATPSAPAVLISFIGIALLTVAALLSRSGLRAELIGAPPVRHRASDADDLRSDNGERTGSVSEIAS